MSFYARNLRSATTDKLSPYYVRQTIIGGSNTTIESNDTQVIGPSSLNVTLNPLAGKLFLKDNPVIIKENSVKAATGTITALDLSRGVVELQVAGAYTLDTTVNIRNRVYDASGTAFVGSPRPMFEVTFHNTSGGAATINPGTGQTFTNVASISISSGNSTTVKFWFITTTTMNVESVSAGTTTTLSNAVAPVAGEAGLVVDGTGPTLSIKKLVAGANVILTNNANDVTIAAAGGGGITEPLFTNVNRAIISGVGNIFTNVNTASFGTVVGGAENVVTMPAGGLSSGGMVTVGGDQNTVTFGANCRGGVMIGGAYHTTYMDTDGCAVVGGRQSNITFNGNGNGSAVLGNTTSTLVFGSRGVGVVGGVAANSTFNFGSGGASTVGGSGRTGVFNANSYGSVMIAASGTINAVNTVLIGGENTTMGTANRCVCIGTSSLTTTLRPNTEKTFIKDSPVYIKENAPKAGVGTILAADITKGVVELQAVGAYTLDSTVNIRNTLLDSTGSAFVGNIRPAFEVTFYNSSGGAATVATGAGQSLTNGVSPISIAAGESRTWKLWFTSATTMLIEDLLSSSAAGGGAVTTLTSAGGTTLVNDGTGPTLAVKGLNSAVNSSNAGFVTGVFVQNNANTLTLINPLFRFHVEARVFGGVSTGNVSAANQWQRIGFDSVTNPPWGGSGFTPDVTSTTVGNLGTAPPAITNAKALQFFVANISGTYSISYSVVIHNSGGAAATAGVAMYTTINDGASWLLVNGSIQRVIIPANSSIVVGKTIMRSLTVNVHKDCLCMFGSATTVWLGTHAAPPVGPGGANNTDSPANITWRYSNPVFP